MTLYKVDMAKFNHLTNNFKSGEFSPKMKARTDLQEYSTSAEQILNMFPMKQGGLTRRGGSLWTNDIVSPNANSGNGLIRSFPFVFSKEEAYVVTIDPSNLEAVPSSALSNQNALSDLNNLSNYHKIDPSEFIRIYPNNGGSLAAVSGDLGNLPTQDGFITTNAVGYKPYFQEQFNIVGIDARGFHYAQSADIMVLTHSSGDIPPLIIARTGESEFTVEWFHKFQLRSYYGVPPTANYWPNVLRMPFQPTNITDATIEGSYVETHRIVTESGLVPPYAVDVGHLNLYDVYELSADKFGTFTFFEGKLGKTFIVNVFDDNEIKTIDFVIVEVLTNNRALAITPRFASTELDFDQSGGNAVNPATTGPLTFPKTDNWSESSWGGSDGWPRTVCFFEQRIIFGGSPSYVDTIWGSRTGNIFVLTNNRFSQDSSGSDETQLGNFIPNNIPDKDKVVDIFGNINLETDPINFRPSSQEINAIQWLSSGQSLMIGTLGAEYVVSGANSALSATSITFRRQTSRGGSPVMPVRVDDEVFYILRDGRAAYNFKFNRNNGSFVSNEISLHADHIIDVGGPEVVSQFVQLEYCTPRNIILCVTSDNVLVGLTYSPANQIMAWHRFDFNGKVHSICSIPSPTGDVDEIYLVMERNDIITLEKIERDFIGESIDDPLNVLNYLDCSKVIYDVPDTGGTLELSPALIGMEVELWVDGAYNSRFEYTGAFNVPECNYAVAGLPMTSNVITNDLNVGGEFGTSLGLTQRIDRIQAILYKSRGVLAGHRDVKLDPIKELSEDLNTGTYCLDFPDGPSEDAVVKIEADGANPLTLLGIVSRGQTHDR